jgi:O-antigen/teichoic acid export membrane protein
MLARLLGATLGVAVPMALARTLAPADFGTYKQAWLLVATLSQILPFGVTMSLYYLVPREPERRGAWIGQALAFTVLAGALAAALLLAGRPFVGAHFDNAALVDVLPWVAASAALVLAGSSLDLAYNSLGRVRAGAAVRVSTEVGRGLAMVAGALLTRSVLGVIAGIAAASALRALAGVALLAREVRLSVRWVDLRRQLAYALPFGAAAALFVPQQSFHQWAVAADVSAAAFAIYAVGAFQLPLVDVLYTPISEVLQLGIAEEERRGRRAAGLELFRDAVGRLAFAFVPLMGFLIAAAPAVISFLFTDRYLEAVPIMRVSVFSIALAALPLDGVLRARADRRFMLGSSAAKLALTVPLVLAGIQLLGMVGAMAGYVVSEALVRAAQLARAARLFGTGLRGVLPWRALGRLAAGTLLAMPGAWAIARAGGPAVLRVGAAAAAFALVHLGLLAWRGWLPAGFRARVRGAWSAPSRGRAAQPGTSRAAS